MPSIMKFLLAYIFLSVAACSGGSDNQAEVSYAADAGTAELKTEPSPAPDAAVADGPVAVAQRQVIRTGEISFETNSADKTRQHIEQAAAQLGAYLADESSSNFGDRTEYRVVLRVPAAQFDALLADISATAPKLDSRTINSQDVTEEFIDVQARLQSKKELEARYRELLKKAAKVEELVAIERELATLRGEIESIEGRLRYLTNQVSLSTLTVVFYERSTTATSYGFELVQSLKGGWQLLLDFLLLISKLWPFFFIGGGSLLLIRRFRSRKNQG